MIPQTIINIYKAVLIKNDSIRYDGSMVCQYQGKLSFLRNFKLFRPKPIKQHILNPVGNKIGALQPDKDLSRSQKLRGARPKCKHCGEYIEYGYKRCMQHQHACERCGIREAIMRVDGHSICCHYNCVDSGEEIQTRKKQK